MCHVNMKILWLPSLVALSVECMLQSWCLAGQLSTRCVCTCPFQLVHATLTPCSTTTSQLAAVSRQNVSRTPWKTQWHEIVKMQQSLKRDRARMGMSTVWLSL